MRLTAAMPHVQALRKKTQATQTQPYPPSGMSESGSWTTTTPPGTASVAAGTTLIELLSGCDSVSLPIVAGVF